MLNPCLIKPFNSIITIHKSYCLVSLLLRYFSGLYCKQYAPRSNCSFWSSLIWVPIVCFHLKIFSEVHLNKCSRHKKQTIHSDRLRFLSNFFYLFRFLMSQSTIFQSCWDLSSWVVSCTRTQHSDAASMETRTSNPFIPSLTLY